MAGKRILLVAGILEYAVGSNFAALPNAATDIKATPPISSGATSWAGLQKNSWAKAVGGWKVVVAMEVASVRQCCGVLTLAEGWVIMGLFTPHFSSDVRRATLSPACQTQG